MKIRPTEMEILKHPLKLILNNKCLHRERYHLKQRIHACPVGIAMAKKLELLDEGTAQQTRLEGRKVKSTNCRAERLRSYYLTARPLSRAIAVPGE
jgi:hypothetical protein